VANFAIYLRRSSPGDEDKNYSIEAQELDIKRQWPEYGQHTLVQRYSDPGGKSYTLARPVFQAMMQDAKDRLFGILVVGRWDRFSRMQEQQAVAVYQLRQYGVNVVSATEPIPDGPVGTLIRNNYAFAAELELYNMRARTYGGKKRRVKSGKLPAQPRPLYGYLHADKEKTRYVEDPESAHIVRHIFDLFMSGMKLRAIARKLTGAGVPTPSMLWAKRSFSGGRGTTDLWSHGTLYKLLANPAYIGQYVGFRHKIEEVEVVHPITKEVQLVKRQVTREEDDEDRVVYGADVCPPLIDEHVFHAAQDLLRRNKEEASRRTLEPESCLLRNGFARCGYCGGYMCAIQVTSGGYRSYRYQCTKRVGLGCPGGGFSWLATELDDITWSFILAQFERPEILRAKYEVWKADSIAGRGIEADRLEAIKAQIQAADKRRRNNMLLASNEEDDDQRADYQHAATAEARHLKELTKDLEALNAILNREDQQDALIDELTMGGPQVAAQIRNFDYDSKRRAMFALKVKMEVRKKGTPDDLKFSWAFGEVFVNTMAYLGATTPSNSVANHAC
jgi:DNA invertase Pin-like site-specific DNA recombinase